MKNIVRYKAGIAAIMLASGMLLSGCSREKGGFELTIKEDNSITAEEDSFVDIEFLMLRCSVVEVHSNVTDKNDIYIGIAEPRDKIFNWYRDIFTNLYFVEDVDVDDSNLLQFVKAEPLSDYLFSLGLVQGKYSYEDMQRIYEEIKAVYKFEEDKDLVKE